MAWAKVHRRRIARLLLVAAVCFGATKIWPAVPQKSDLRIELGPQHREIMELHLDFMRDGEHLQSASFRFPLGAPESLRHEISLPTGRYDVRVQCRRASATTSVEREIELPSSDVVRINATGDRV